MNINIPSTGIAPTMSAELEDATVLDPQTTDAAPTQGIAWSSEDDIDTVVDYNEPERRSWYAPITATTIAIAAIAAAIFLAWPTPRPASTPVAQTPAAVIETRAPAPAVAVVPPTISSVPALVTTPPTKDEVFAAFLRSEGIPRSHFGDLGLAGRTVCESYQNGMTRQEGIDAMAASPAHLGPLEAEEYLAAAAEIYCPSLTIPAG